MYTEYSIISNKQQKTIPSTVKYVTGIRAHAIDTLLLNIFVHLQGSTAKNNKSALCVRLKEVVSLFRVVDLSAHFRLLSLSLFHTHIVVSSEYPTNSRAGTILSRIGSGQDTLSPLTDSFVKLCWLGFVYRTM